MNGWAPNLRDETIHNAAPFDVMPYTYGTPNMMFHDAPPARLAAMIDQELSTIGDPMLDLGWLCGGMRDERWDDVTSGSGLNNPDHFPTRQELARYYCAGTGCDPAEFDCCLVLAGFKSGCQLEYKVAQAAAGILPARTGEFFARVVDGAFARNARFVERLAKGL